MTPPEGEGPLCSRDHPPAHYAQIHTNDTHTNDTPHHFPTHSPRGVYIF